MRILEHHANLFQDTNQITSPIWQFYADGHPTFREFAESRLFECSLRIYRNKKLFEQTISEARVQAVKRHRHNCFISFSITRHEFVKKLNSMFIRREIYFPREMVILTSVTLPRAIN